MENKRYGDWIHEGYGLTHCSECGLEIKNRDIAPQCPACGACMEPDPELMEPDSEWTEIEEPNDECLMNRQETLDYIRKHFSCSNEAMRLIDNILAYVEAQGVCDAEQFVMLQALLDGSIGLSNDEIRRISL